MESRVSVSFNTTGPLVLTTATGGAISGRSGVLNGRLRTLQYEAHGTTPFSNGATITVTTSKTGRVLVNGVAVTASRSFCPLKALHGTDGVAIDGQNDYFEIGDEQLIVAIAGGGDAKIGSFYFIVG